MTKSLLCVLVACLSLAGGAAIRVSAGQDRTPQPGQATQAKVWIQNRGEQEAVPVSIQTMANEAPPMRVQVIGTPTVTMGAPGGLIRAARQPWEYKNLTVPSDQDPAGILNAAGADGWETTGVVVALQGGTLVVVKRPR
jgi:hypothetical protein